MAAQDDVPLVELESYIQAYSGRGVVDRLLFIADRSPGLLRDALSLALARLAVSADVSRYSETLNRLGGLDLAAVANADPAWVENVSRDVRARGDKLQLELKSYKNNLIKESIRMAHAELADYYFDIADLNNAGKYLTRQREYCTTHRHVQDLQLDLVAIGLHQHNWSQVESALAKLDAIPVLAGSTTKGKTTTTTTTTTSADTPFVLVARGLRLLAAADYAGAACVFLQLPTDSFTPATSPSGGDGGDVDGEVVSKRQITNFVSAADVAVYIGLCALATFDRASLQRMCDNSTTGLLLEPEPHVRDLVDAFLRLDYRTVWALLDRHRPGYHIDLWLADHVPELFDTIRQNCYVQYVQAYKRGLLTRMADRFGADVTVTNVRDSLVDLICRGKLTVKLDLENNYFVDSTSDERSGAYDKVMAVASSHEISARLLLVNVAVIQGGLEISSGNQQEQQKEK
ncbi:26S proteasome subunit RPN7-domain-containing protein [Lipomyces japonicus]|uniref:26S proteasome subunit RPN7-domain-containing protein n=1 Tax=Lipomyces japonicus TaxID=56871 RepID=UPI0034CEB52C